LFLPFVTGVICRVATQLSRPLLLLVPSALEATCNVEAYAMQGVFCYVYAEPMPSLAAAAHSKCVEEAGTQPTSSFLGPNVDVPCNRNRRGEALDRRGDKTRTCQLCCTRISILEHPTNLVHSHRRTRYGTL
jgi:hypothetical protein